MVTFAFSYAAKTQKNSTLNPDFALGANKDD